MRRAFVIVLSMLLCYGICWYLFYYVFSRLLAAAEDAVLRLFDNADCSGTSFSTLIASPIEDTSAACYGSVKITCSSGSATVAICNEVNCGGTCTPQSSTCTKMLGQTQVYFKYECEDYTPAGGQAEVVSYLDSACTGSSAGTSYTAVGDCNLMQKYKITSCNGTSATVEPCNGADWKAFEVTSSKCTSDASVFGAPGATVQCTSDASAITATIALVVAVAAAVAMLTFA